MLKNKKHIIFDWNGTLVDDAWIFVDILNVLLNARDLNTITIKQYRDQFCFPIKSFYKNLGVDVSKKSFLKLEREFIREYAKRMYQPILFENVPKLLSKLLNAGFGLSILSASHKNILIEQAAYYKIGSYFKHIVGVNNYNANGKINKGKELLKKINSKCDEILLIGDTDYDFIVASKMNIDCVLVSNGHQSLNQLNKTGATILNNLNELHYKIIGTKHDYQ